MKKIPLTQGKFALVDDENYDWLMQYKWCAQKRRNTFYAATTIKLGKNQWTSLRMHQLIINQKLNKNEEIHHINGNGLDNCAHNLEILTRSHHRAMDKKQINTTSKYKGVCFNKRNNKWKSEITVNLKKINIGTFISEIDAARAYDKFAIKYFQQYARLNFPDFDYSDYTIKKTKRKTNSGLHGVSWSNCRKVYATQIHLNKKLIFHKCGVDKIKVAKARDQFIVENHLDQNKYLLNFPEDY